MSSRTPGASALPFVPVARLSATPESSETSSAPLALSAAPRFPDPIPSVIPFGTVTLIAGAPGVGKTAMLAEWIVRMSTGRSICGHPTNPPTAAYFLAADRQWTSHQIWFDAVGYPQIPHYSVADDHSLDLEQLHHARLSWKFFLACVAKLNPIPGSHLYVDPVAPLFISGDQNKARDVAATMLRFSRLCSTLQINITCSIHFSKQRNDPREQYTRAQDRISGSGAFAGFSDTQIYLVDPNPPDQPYHLLGWVPRHAKPEEFQFTRESSSGLFVPSNSWQALDKEEEVLALIPQTPTRTNQILLTVCQQLSLSRATAERYLKLLLQQSRITRVSRGVYQRTNPS